MLCNACQASQWCSHWFITGKNGQTIPCSAEDMETLEVEFDPPALPREEGDSNCDDVRQDVRGVMKVVPPSSSRECHRYLHIIDDSADICFRCKKSDWEIVTWSPPLPACRGSAGSRAA